MNNSIIDIIRNRLLEKFLGRKNAKNRALLLGYIHYFEPGLKDRTMRRIYNAILPIGHCKDGIYVIDDPKEVEKMQKVIAKVIQTYEYKYENLEILKKFLIQREKEKQSGQMQLPLGGV